MKVLKIILMAVYAFNAVGIAGTVFLGDTAKSGLTVAGQLLVVVLSVIAIIALAGKGGRSARSATMAFAGLILVLGTVFSIFWVYLLIAGESESLLELGGMIVFVIVGGSTIAALRDRSSSDEAGATGETE